MIKIENGAYFGAISEPVLSAAIGVLSHVTVKERLDRVAAAVYLFCRPLPTPAHPWSLPPSYSAANAQAAIMLFGSLKQFERLDWLGQIGDYTAEAWPLPVFRNIDGDTFHYDPNDLTNLDKRVIVDVPPDRVASGHGEFSGINNIRAIVANRCGINARLKSRTDDYGPPDMLF